MRRMTLGCMPCMTQDRLLQGRGAFRRALDRVLQIHLIHIARLRVSDVRAHSSAFVCA
jgi:hypothetical protein